MPNESIRNSRARAVLSRRYTSIPSTCSLISGHFRTVQRSSGLFSTLCYRSKSATSSFQRAYDDVARATLRSSRYLPAVLGPERCAESSSRPQSSTRYDRYGLPRVRACYNPVVSVLDGFLGMSPVCDFKAPSIPQSLATHSSA